MSSDKKLKICHVITRMIVGGAQENTLLSLIGQMEKGHEVTLVTGPSPGREGKLLQNINCPPFETVEIPSLVRNLDPFNDWKAYRELVKFFRERKFDVVHTHSSKAGIIGRIAARHAGVPVVVHTVHGQAFHPYAGGLKNAFYKFSEWLAAKYSDRIFAVAQAMIDQCVAAGIAPRNRYMVVYSGMDTSAFANSRADAELRSQLGIPEDAQVVVTVARLFPQKGYEYVIPAAAELLKEYPKLHFLIVGDGPMYDSLRSQLNELKIAEHFHFAGLVPPGEVHRYLSLGNLLWHLSLHEGLPRSVVQALATGIPAIGFRLDGTPEVAIDDRTGYCVDAEDIHAVAERTRKLLDHPEFSRELGANGKAMVLAQFDWHRMADILTEEYLRLFAQRKPR